MEVSPRETNSSTVNFQLLKRSSTLILWVQSLSQRPAFQFCWKAKVVAKSWTWCQWQALLELHWDHYTLPANSLSTASEKQSRASWKIKTSPSLSAILPTSRPTSPEMLCKDKVRHSERQTQISRMVWPLSKPVTTWSKQFTREDSKLSSALHFSKLLQRCYS